MACNCTFIRVIILVIGMLFTSLLSAEVSAPLQLHSDFSNTDLPRTTGPASLTVSGDNYWNRRFLETGEYPEISALDEEGNVLPDGRYSYELRSIPDTSEADGTAGAFLSSSEEPSVLKSGFFRVESGRVVSP